jgi:hypothetical protein
MLSAWVQPVRPHTVVVDRDELAVGDSQRQSLQRALVTRLQFTQASTAAGVPEPCTIGFAPVVHILDNAKFSHGKARMKKLVPVVEVVNHIAATRGDVDCNRADAINAVGLSEVPPAKRRKKNPLSPCGFSINWFAGADITVKEQLSVLSTENKSNGVRAGSEATSDHARRKPRKPRPLVAGGSVEVTVAHTGVLQGTVRDNIGTAGAVSRLSRYAMRQTFEQIVEYCARIRDASALASRMLCCLADGITAPSKGTTTGSASAAIDGCAGVTTTDVGCVVEQQLEHDPVQDVPAAIGVQGTATVDPIPQSSNLVNNVADRALEVASVVRMVRDAKLRDLKVICGRRYYDAAKVEFLSHPVFKDWLCDDD